MVDKLPVALLSIPPRPPIMIVFTQNMQGLLFVLFPVVVMLAAVGLERLEARLLGAAAEPDTARPGLEVIQGGAAAGPAPRFFEEPPHWLGRGA